MAEYAVVNKTQLDADMTSVADTIRTKGGTSEQLAWPDGYNAAIEAIQTGGGTPVEVVEKDVNFYDYDGTLLHSYTLAEAQALTELPPGPDWHSTLVFTEWNWTLEDLQALDRNMDVGAVYTTIDGTTRLHLSIDTVWQTTIPLYLNQTSSEGVEIDWGDGSEVETISGTGNVTTTHTYDGPGKYVVKLRAASGTFKLGGTQDLLGGGSIPRSTLTRLEIGDNMTGVSGSFTDCKRLETVSGKCQVTNYCFRRNNSLKAFVVGKGYSINNESFYECTSLKRICTSKSCTTTAINGLIRCYALNRIELSDEFIYFGRNSLDGTGITKLTLPERTDGFNANACSNCQILTEITITPNVLNIYASVFSGCTSLKFVKFMPKTPPTVHNANAFNGLPTDCIIEVPAGGLEAYTTATNYPSAATYTYVEASE